MSQTQAAEALARLVPGGCYPSRIAKLEERGTDSYTLIHALATIYEKPVAEVAEAARTKKCDIKSNLPLTSV